MALRLRLGDHPLHPALVHFPVALWTLAAGAELGGWLFGQTLWWQFSFICQALGLIGGLLAIGTGLLDYGTIPHRHPAREIAIGHMMLMCLSWLLFLLSLALRGLPPDQAPPPWATAAAGAGFAAMAFGGWLGGRLVYHYGVGVSSGAEAR